MLEVVIPAASGEAVRAAVQNGAGAVYLASAAFSDRTLAEAVKYCRIRGAKAYLSLPQTVHDGAFNAALHRAHRAAELGISAIETGDLGLLRTLRRLFPALPLHFASGAINAAGVATAAYLGASRVILSPDLELDEITTLCRAARIELELPCHGPVCTGAGFCRAASFIGNSRSAGSCSMPCRREFGAVGTMRSFYLSRKDLCLAHEFESLRNTGLRAVRILGEQRQAEYSALTARIYSAAAAGRPVAQDALALLEDTFAPGGMTCGFFRGASDDLFAQQTDRPRYISAALGNVREGYLHSEADLIPARLAGIIAKDKPVKIFITDDEGHRVCAEGSPPKEAFGREETSSVQLKTHLYNLVSSPFYCREAVAEVQRGLYVPPAELIALRKKAVSELSRQRSEFTASQIGTIPQVEAAAEPLTPPDINISVRRASQLSPQLAGLKPEILYVPLSELLEHPGAITPFWENGVTTICAMLPPLIHARQDSELPKHLEKLKELQIHNILVTELGQIFPAAARGFTIRAGIELGAYNSHTLTALKALRVASVAVPPELKFSEIRALSKALPIEAVMYGRLVLMHSEADIAAAAGTDQLRSGRSIYPILPEYDGCSALFSSERLFLAGRRKDYDRIGLWCIRLDFTTESAEECVLTAQRFLGQNKYTPTGTCNGLYY